MPLLEVKHLHTFFTTKKGIVKAVNDVSYTLESGKTIGIVGESGSGKSVSAMSILQLLDGNGYIDSGLSPTAVDQYYIGNDIVPPSFRVSSDSMELNSISHKLIGKLAVDYDGD